MLILGLLGMNFDAAVVFVTSQTLLLKLAVATLCWVPNKRGGSNKWATWVDFITFLYSTMNVIPSGAK